MNILGIISILFFTSCFIPQIISILKTRNISGISIWLWILVIAGYVTGLLYVASLKVAILIVSYSIGLTLSLLTTILIISCKPKT